MGLILLFLLLYIVPLGFRPLVVPDESRYAEIPREMLATGDWVVPRLNGLRYFEKPPLGYWLTAASIAMWGPTRLAVRWPAAMSTGITALLIAWFVWRSSRRSHAAVLSAAVFLTSAEVFGLGVYNVLDAPFSMFVAASLVFFWFAYAATTVWTRAAWLTLFGVACGLGFLTKGFLALAIPAVVLAPFLLWEKRWRELFTWPWLPLAAAFLVALPWSLAIHRREPDFWRYFFWVEHVQRFASREEAQHAAPFWYYLPVLLGGFLPWTFLLPAGVVGLRHNRPWPPWLRFAFLAFLAPFVFFSVSRGKIGTYILPCFPWLAVCTAIGVVRCDELSKRTALKIGMVLSCFAALAAAVAALVIQIHGLPNGMRPYAEHETWRWLLVFAGLGFWALASLLATATRNSGERWALCAIAPALLMFGIHLAVPETFINRKAPEAFLRQFADRVPPEAAVVTDNNLVHLVCWVYKRHDVYLLDSRGELEYGLSYPDARERLLTVDTFNELIRQHAPEGPVVLIAEKRDLEKYWKGRIPEPGFRAENEKFFIATFRTPMRRVPTP